ncbi:hypothetical protein I316_05697 [Kwoniella heveanensis BCC8398]|uniref:Mediator of RNA polymerase II transcription subunit 12 n=1 Tax=Kwoniella heveanensis BCC8398 TaxID=1296120 RepID=A0A1B9GND6_9TREE|nr:hypothetical protein I316_05697 [Kwoniella heveanensis BCC8398]
MPTHRYPPGVNPYAPLPTSSSMSGVGSSSNRVPNQHPLKSGRPSSLSRAGVTAPKVLLDDADIEDFAPPEWRTVMNSRVDLGYPDFYPSRPGFDQPEDVLTEENVKNGFSGRNFVAVGAEVFSMHGPIHQHLSSGGLNLLQQLGKELIEKRQELMPQVGERTFRIPVRVTYNDTKRLQFLADLSNPNVPLHRLMRTPVPHGFKGVELLDAMFSPSTGPGTGHNRNPSGGVKLSSEPIPLDRALWFIRVLGANEISAHRGRTQPLAVATPVPVSAPSPAVATPSSTTTIAATPTLPVTSNDWYTQEFTNTFITWLRIQLGQLALPNSNKTVIKSGAPPPKGPASVLNDENGRAKWLAKWDYSARLMRELYNRHLLSSRILSGWLSDYLSHSNLAQLGFVAQMIGEHLPDMAKHMSNARYCVRAACEKLKEIRSFPATASLAKVEAMLISIIKSLYETSHEALLSPTTWRLHSDLLQTLLPSTSNTWDDLRRRNEALWFSTIVDERSSSPRRQQMAEIQKLDSICEDTNMIDLTKSFFDGTSSASLNNPDILKLEEKIFILLNWAMGLFQLGSHRPYAVYTILKHWHNQHEEHQSKQPRPHVIEFFPILYKWLDTSAAARKEENVHAIGITIGELTRQGIFSYGQYLQALISKGQTARSSGGTGRKSHHLALLKAMPIFVVAKDLLHQRRIALCGDDLEARKREENDETQLMDQFKDEVMEYVPEVFGLKRYKRSAELREVLDYQLPTSSKMSRYLYVQARFWLAPDAGFQLKARGDTPAMDASTFARVLQVFRSCRGFATIADFVIRALQDSEDDAILDVILDTVRRDADVWTSMDGWSRLGDRLLDRYHGLQTQGRDHRRTLDFLVMLADKGRLTPDEQEEVTHLEEEMPKPATEDIPAKLDFKESLHGLQQALVHGREEAAVALAPKLFTRHGSFSNWSTPWWTAIIDLLQHPAHQHANSGILRTTISHIVAVEKDTRNALNPLINGWLGKMTPSALIDMLGRRAGPTICQLLLELVYERCLSVVTVLDRLVYPIWKYASTTVLVPRKRLSGKQTQAVVSSVNIAAQVLVSPPLAHSFSSLTVFQSIILLASRQAVFCGTNVQGIIRHVPLLVVLERIGNLPETTSETARATIRRLAMTAEFKTAAFRNLNVLKDAFLSSEWTKPSLDAGLEDRMVDTLKLIMSEKPLNALTPAPKPGLPNLDNNARFSAWRWTRIVLEMRVEFKGLAMRIANGEEVAEARQTLNRLVHVTLDRETTPDDTDLLCEAFGGMDTVVTQEILAAGMDRLSSLLSQAIGAETQHQLEGFIRSIDQVLRILDSTNRQPKQVISDHVVLAARHKLLDLLAVALQSTERNISSDQDLMIHHDISPPQPGDFLKVVLNLLKFALGILAADPSSPSMPKPNFPHLAAMFFKVVVACHTALVIDSTQMMCDMLAYIIDCTPPQSRLACQIALLGETTPTAVQAILADMPIVSSILPHLSPVMRNTALVGSDVTDDHPSDSALPLDDRKWELFEQMEPRPRQIKHQDLYLSSASLKDTSSIPLALFSPTMTRDALPGTATTWSDELTDNNEKEDEACPWEELASERDLGDGFAGQPGFAKQSATSMFDGVEEYNIAEPPTPPSSHESSDESASAVLLSAQPRRMSTRISTHALPHGAENYNPSNGASSNTSTSKRGSGSNKDPISIDEDDSDDEPETVDPRPAAKRPRTSSKSTASNTAGRQTTGGKAPAGGARKTTGGKGVSRKATSGKSVKGTGSKAPKGGGRRKSQAD